MSNAAGTGRDTGLRRTSSLVFDTTAKRTLLQERPTDGRERNMSSRKKETIVIPDSEEETDRAYDPPYRSFASPVKQNQKLIHEVIQLSSDSDSEEEATLAHLRSKERNQTNAEDPFLDKILPSPPIPRSTKQIPRNVECTCSDEDSSDGEPVRLPKTKTPGRSAWTRRTIVSDSEESADVDEEQLDANNENDVDDGAILVLNDPPTARRPLAKPHALPSFARLTSSDLTNDVKETPGGGHILIADRTPLQTPVHNRLSDDSGHMPGYFDTEPASPTKKKGGKRKNMVDSFLKDNVPSEGPSNAAKPSSTQTKKGGRVSKKALEAARQEQLQAYAAQLFIELNEKVFDSMLPSTTALIWNKRLQTTAGKATWHSSATKGVETTSIELAPKVIDCEERIRNTLSHEMCHLAAWVINRKPTENHGSIFMDWARRVMQKRPDIVVSTKHSYDIAYKYEWKCQNPECGYVYGRHSKSIDHTKTMCGVCKGDLLPLFQTRARKTKADARLEADKKRDSPTFLDKFLSPSVPVVTPSRLRVVGLPSGETDSGMSLDGDDIVEVPPPSKNKESDNTDRVVSGLIKHLSIIDLTDD